MKSVISKVLRQSDLYHNPDPLSGLVGEANECNVIVEGWETRALLDFWLTVIGHFMDMGKGIELKAMTTPIHFTN